jgi:CRISPR-associated exonuclease Cas4
VDTVGHESRRLFRQEYGMGVRSLRYGLTGRCDLVEVRLDMGGRVIEALPVEFKRGGNKEDDRDRVQLCAQALCLEEMLGIAVPRGQLYYRKEHRRSSVEINGDLRQTTIRLIGRIKEIRDAGITPPAVYLKKKCDTCSLVELCMPQSAGSGGKRVDRYIQAQIRLSKEAESS